MIRELAGLEPERLSFTELKFQRGSCASIAGDEFAEFSSGYTIDTAVDGAGGMAYCGFNSGVDYFPYVIKNTVSGDFDITLSDEISTSTVLLPSEDWIVFRKLPWGFCAVNGAYISGGTSGVPEIPTFHLSHWPKPLTVLTQATTKSNFCKVLVKKSASAWTGFACTKLIPDNARLGSFLLVVEGSGEALIRSGSFQGEGVGLTAGQHFLEHRVASDRKLYYKTTGSAKLTCYIMGYSQTEPS